MRSRCKAAAAAAAATTTGALRVPTQIDLAPSTPPLPVGGRPFAGYRNNRTCTTFYKPCLSRGGSVRTIMLRTEKCAPISDGSSYASSTATRFISRRASNFKKQAVHFAFAVLLSARSVRRVARNSGSVLFQCARSMEVEVHSCSLDSTPFLRLSGFEMTLRWC